MCPTSRFCISEGIRRKPALNGLWIDFRGFCDLEWEKKIDLSFSLIGHECPVMWLVLLLGFFPYLCPSPPSPSLTLQGILVFGWAFLPIATVESRVHSKQAPSENFSLGESKAHLGWY